MENNQKKYQELKKMFQLILVKNYQRQKKVTQYKK